MKNSKAVALLFALMLLGVLLVLVSSLLSFWAREYLVTGRHYKIQQALALAEAGIDKAIIELDANVFYTGTTTPIALGSGSFSVMVSGSADFRIIESTGEVGSIEKTIKVSASVTGDKTEFHYGAHVGNLGLYMANGSTISGAGATVGNVYSNGSIGSYPIGSDQRGFITGDAWVAKNVNGITNQNVQGSVHTANCTNTTIGNILYYVVGGNIQICPATNGSQEDPDNPVEIPEQTLPITQATIDNWKSEAAANGTISGGYTLPGGTASLGPKKIEGDMLIDNNAILTMTGTIWVKGNITIRNGATVQLDSGYGWRSGVIVADCCEPGDQKAPACIPGVDPDCCDPAASGKIRVKQGVTVRGSGMPGSFIMLLSANAGTGFVDSPTEPPANTPATIVEQNTHLTGIYYTSAGMIVIENNASLKEVTAQGLALKNNVQIIYESGLASTYFASGPGGGWGIKKGTWTIVK